MIAKTITIFRDQSKKEINFWIVFLLMAVFFYLIKFFSPAFIDYIYQNGSYKILNFLSQSSGVQSNGFYQGEIEVYLFGPLKSLISGILLLGICLRYFSKATAFQFGLVMIGYILLTRFEVLFYPPYGEAITGPFTDTLWLYQNNFDYARFIKQGTYVTGGPQIYPLSIFPIFLLLLMYLTPTTLSFLIVAHLLIFIFTAVLLAIVRETFRKVFPEKTAIVTAIFLLSLPLFQSMLEQLNMEITCTMFAVLCAYFLMERKIGLASIMAILSLMVKAPGGIACGAVFLVSIVLYFMEENHSIRFRRLLWGSLAFTAAIMKFVLRNYIINKQVGDDNILPFSGWVELSQLPSFWIYCICAAIFIFVLLKNSFFKKERNLALGANWSSTVMFTMAAAWVLLFLNFDDLAPRYTLLATPFFIFSLVYAVNTLVRKEWFCRGIIIVFIILANLNSHGFIYANEPIKAKNPTLLERSLEYRNYFKMQRETAKTIEQNYADYTIGAPIQFAESLGVPELGYVSKQMDVVVYGFPAKLKGLRPFKALKYLDGDQTVWVGLDYFRSTDKVDFPFGPGDMILKRIAVGHNESVIFMGGYGIEEMRVYRHLYRMGFIKSFY